MRNLNTCQEDLASIYKSSKICLGTYGVVQLDINTGLLSRNSTILALNWPFNSKPDFRDTNTTYNHTQTYLHCPHCPLPGCPVAGTWDGEVGHGVENENAHDHDQLK